VWGTSKGKTRSNAGQRTEEKSPRGGGLLGLLVGGRGSGPKQGWGHQELATGNEQGTGSTAMRKYVQNVGEKTIGGIP